MILVTGAAGFVGRYVVDQLVQNGEDVLALVHDAHGMEYYSSLDIPVYSTDISTPLDALADWYKSADAIVHTAGLLSIDSPRWSSEDYFDVNIKGMYNVLEYARRVGCKKVVNIATHSDTSRCNEKVIYEDTPICYGGGDSGRPGTIAYITSKIAAMNMLNAYALEYGMQGISLRLPGIRGYGSRDTFYNCVFHQFIQKALKGEPIPIWGKHETYRDLVYIKDVVQAVVCSLKSDSANGLYNIGSGSGLTILEEAQHIIDVFCEPGEVSDIEFHPEIDEVRKNSWIFSISKAKRELGYFPRYSYREGLEDFKKEMELNRFDGLQGIESTTPP
jgi:nucleoside-diphosphate-sugar epimerase